MLTRRSLLLRQALTKASININKTLLFQRAFNFSTTEEKVTFKIVTERDEEFIVEAEVGQNMM